ncbi:MAG TPA: DUF3473 domain-containing protein [Planctomycetota bacterium]|nr:DUF3473 domain-containing protein [Planctomycetota bacterium]
MTAPTLALTVDLEEWNDGLGLPPGEPRVEMDVAWLLEAFSAAGVRATFFVLGGVLDRHPGLVRGIAREGHEIGFHGARHVHLERVGAAAFDRELAEWLPRLEDVAGCAVAGYRAPFFSITRRTAWALEILSSRGIRFDASIYPGPNDRYGWWGAPREPVRLPGGLALFPVPVLHDAVPLAYSGGAYLRILPRWVVRWGLSRERARDRLGMVYVHPWEVSARRPDAGEASWRALVTRELRQRRMRACVCDLLTSEADRAAPMGEVLSARGELPTWDPTPSDRATPVFARGRA